MLATWRGDGRDLGGFTEELVGGVVAHLAEIDVLLGEAAEVVPAAPVPAAPPVAPGR